MEFDISITTVRNFAIALFIGALIGIEREKKQKSDERDIGGIRTFILFAETGALSAWLSVQLESMAIFAVTVGAVSAAVITGYLTVARANPKSTGLTTEVAAIIVMLLGAATMFGYPGGAVALGIFTSAILAYKEPIHAWVNRIGRDDIIAGIKLLIASFIVLPLLPNRTIDPLQSLNPYKIWLLVILISSLSLMGYVAVKMLGERVGMALTGFFGGLVSSTAVTLNFAKLSKEDGSSKSPEYRYAVPVLLAWLVMFARVVVEVVVVNRALLSTLLIPFAAMGGVSLACTAWMFFRDKSSSKTKSSASTPLDVENPFRLWPAFKFAMLFALILVVVKLVQRYSTGEGLYFVAALAGLTDVDAITLTMANYAKESGNMELAARAIAIAAISNTLVKAGMILFLGGRGMRMPILLSTMAILVGAIVGVFFI